MEKRQIGDYTILSSVLLGEYEIIMGENANAADDEKYICAYVENNGIFERGFDCMASSSFVEIADLYGERISEKARELQSEIEKEDIFTGDNREITSSDCDRITDADRLVGKVIVIRGDSLRPEFKRATHQLLLCTGGFGAEQYARGRTCYCISLYDGRQTSFYRSDILGVIEPEKLPKWAQNSLVKTREMCENGKKQLKERGTPR